MDRFLALLPHARLVVFGLGVFGPLALMGMRGERIDVQVAVAVFAGIAAGCSIRRAPVVLRFAAIVAAVGAMVFQAIDVFGEASQWGISTAPVLWALQGMLLAALIYLLLWNQRQLMRS
ncbi:hypothetical protein [Gymnodinialimonas sp. 57CJ19]|uniref:hypothetical protein n=1 Tax=Gymnodinialimonas sp. 57CJ19 TaxID=3138498 RepID=UPI0031343F4A